MCVLCHMHWWAFNHLVICNKQLLRQCICSVIEDSVVCRAWTCVWSGRDTRAESRNVFVNQDGQSLMCSFTTVVACERKAQALARARVSVGKELTNEVKPLK